MEPLLLTVNEAISPLPAAFRQGLTQFNQGDYFAAHETWEELWRPAVGQEKRFLQGLIQVAVGLHHWRNGNPGGARSLLTRGLAKLDRVPFAYTALDIDDFVRTLLARVARIAPERR